MEVSLDSFKSRLQKINVGKNVTFDSAVYQIYKKASVLIPLFFKDGIPHVILTLRSRKLKNAPSTVSFPGGMHDTTDLNEVETALREAEEEIGLLPSQVEILSVLPLYIVWPNFIVTPILGLIPENFSPVPNKEEVELVFDLPLSRFLNTDYSVSCIDVFGEPHNVFHFKDHIAGRELVTWGYTAMMCLLVALCIFEKEKFHAIRRDSREMDLGLMLETLQFFLNLTVENAIKSKL